MTKDEAYVWDLVHAAIGLPRAALPYAAHTLAVRPLNALPAETRAYLHGLLHALGDVERSPAVESFLAALAHGPGARDSAHWATVCALRQELHAEAAFCFIQQLAAAGARRFSQN